MTFLFRISSVHFSAARATMHVAGKSALVAGPVILELNVLIPYGHLLSFEDRLLDVGRGFFEVKV